MAAKVWYVAAGKKKAGPMTSDRLRRQLSVGKLPKGALAWRDGMEAWEPVVEIDHLQPREADGGAEAQGSASSVEVAVPAQRTAAPKQRSTARSTPSGAGKASRSGSRKGLKGTSGSRKARTAKPATGAGTVEAGAFKPNFRFERKDMWQAFGLGLELGRVKLALAGMLLPAGASAVLGGVALVAAKLHVLLALGDDVDRLARPSPLRRPSAVSSTLPPPSISPSDGSGASRTRKCP